MMTLSIDKVTKVFKTGIFSKKTAVHDVSLHLPAGQIAALIGANGSGKSTIFKMILGVLRPTKGKITIYQSLPEDISSRKCIGYVPDTPHFQSFLTAKEILTYYAKLLQIPRWQIPSRIESVLKIVGLMKDSNQKIDGFSKGMIQRLAIAQAILHDPSLLLLDEPTSGLDPLGQREMIELIKHIYDARPNLSILLSTHSLSEASLLSHYVYVLKEGSLDRSGSVFELLASAGQHEKELDLPKYKIFVYGKEQKLLEIQESYAKFSPTFFSSQLVFQVEDVSRLALIVSELKQKRDIVISLADDHTWLEKELYLPQHSSNKESKKSVSKLLPHHSSKHHPKHRRAS